MRLVKLLLLLAVVAWVAGSAHLRAQDWPSKPLHFVVPFAAGGSTDVLTRLLCEQLTIELKVPCVVENKAGAGGNVDGMVVATSPPDGYIFLISAPGMLTYNKILYRDVAFDPDRDLEPVCLYAFQPNVLVVHPTLPVASVKEETVKWRKVVLESGAKAD
jgi:tripartite-type tricarboxylate transporter receptor subunit TctC